MSDTNGTHPTEQEMRAAKVPWLDTPEELTAYIAKLVDRPHAYGTCVYAMSMAAVAAFYYVARKLGVTGFQASCADMDILTRTRSFKGPWRIMDFSNLLYPQYLHSKHFPAIADLEGEHAQWLADEARKLLAESPNAHPNVVARWNKLAARVPATATQRTASRWYTEEFRRLHAQWHREQGIPCSGVEEDMYCHIADVWAITTDRRNADVLRAAQSGLPEKDCFTLPDGSCGESGPCIHSADPVRYLPKPPSVVTGQLERLRETAAASRAGGPEGSAESSGRRPLPKPCMRDGCERDADEGGVFCSNECAERDGAP